MKIKIRYIYDGFDFSHEEVDKINSWFDLNLFEIPFLPQIGMKIDLVDFYTNEEDEDVYLSYAEIKDIIILRDYIELHC
jgi:hypothetical protein